MSSSGMYFREGQQREAMGDGPTKKAGGIRAFAKGWGLTLSHASPPAPLEKTTYSTGIPSGSIRYIKAPPCSGRRWLARGREVRDLRLATGRQKDEIFLLTISLNDFRNLLNDK